MSDAEEIPKNIVLIGFMGSGKSTVGRDLHQRLGYPLVDMDQTIERAEGRKIAAIFAQEGEAVFRDMETALLQKLAAPGGDRTIISTGGGVVARAENRELLRRLGYVVWLDAPLELIDERTGKSRDRPLLNDGKRDEKIRSLLEQRRPWYRETAHLRVDVADLECHEVATGILESARYFFARS